MNSATPSLSLPLVCSSASPARCSSSYTMLQLLLLAPVVLAAVSSPLATPLDDAHCVGSTCTLSSPDGQQCSQQSDCPPPQTCVHESQYYAQCVDCNATVFATQCNYYSPQFLVKAMEVCGIKQCGTRCPHHVDTDCTEPNRCAVQAGGVWSQCIDCNATVFDVQCKSWSAGIKTAAEALCKETCPVEVIAASSAA